MENGGGAGFLTTVVVLIALLLPVLVLFEAWRSRRVSLADDAQEATLDPVLSTSGMSRKIVFGMVVLTEAFLLLIAYGANEPFRKADARERQKEFAVEAAAHTYVQYCVSCHGVSGKGYLENIGLVGKPLATSALQSTDVDEYKANVRMITQTLVNGRNAGAMPAWGVENGGPLNYQMINELTLLITEGRWDAVEHLAKDKGVMSPTEAPITDPVAAGKLIVTQGACASCHAVSGTAAKGAVGPALDGIANRKIGGVAEFNAANMKKWVTNPGSLKPGSSMPGYALKDSYLDAIAAYLATLK
ncbi:MAG: c-type cytochrome [Chloroflexi bacterium]|nr:c-type cytochrome [Chloroflexota bacterium]